MTDEEIDAVIEHALPDLRIALKDMFSRHKIYHAFDFCVGTNSQTGIKSKYVLFLTHEPVAALFEKVAEGLREMELVYQRLLNLPSLPANKEEQLAGGGQRPS